MHALVQQYGSLVVWCSECQLIYCTLISVAVRVNTLVPQDVLCGATDSGATSSIISQLVLDAGNRVGYTVATGRERLRYATPRRSPAAAGDFIAVTPWRGRVLPAAVEMESDGIPQFTRDICFRESCCGHVTSPKLRPSRMFSTEEASNWLHGQRHSIPVS